MTDTQDTTGDFGSYAAAAFLLTLLVGVVAVSVIAALRLPIEGTVPAETVVSELLRPLAIGIAAVIVLGSYVSMKKLWGSRRTRSALTTLVSLAKEAGAAEQLREQNGHDSGGDNEGDES